MTTIYKLIRSIVYDNPVWAHNRSECFGHFITQELANKARDKHTKGCGYKYRFGSGERAGTVTWDVWPVPVKETEDEL
jgi:hypothetical protein